MVFALLKKKKKKKELLLHLSEILNDSGPFYTSKKKSLVSSILVSAASNNLEEMSKSIETLEAEFQQENDVVPLEQDYSNLKRYEYFLDNLTNEALGLLVSDIIKIGSLLLKDLLENKNKMNYELMERMTGDLDKVIRSINMNSNKPEKKKGCLKYFGVILRYKEELLSLDYYYEVRKVESCLEKGYVSEDHFEKLIH